MSLPFQTYVLQAEGGGPLKIGKAWDPHSRRGELQVGNPRKLILLGIIPDFEKRVHHALRTHRLSGEWFAPTEPVLEYLKQHGIEAKPEECEHCAAARAHNKKLAAALRHARLTIREQNRRLNEIAELTAGRFNPKRTVNWEPRIEVGEGVSRIRLEDGRVIFGCSSPGNDAEAH